MYLWLFGNLTIPFLMRNVRNLGKLIKIRTNYSQTVLVNIACDVTVHVCGSLSVFMPDVCLYVPICRAADECTVKTFWLLRQSC